MDPLKPKLPVMLWEVFPHVIKDESQLSLVRYGSTVTNREPNYYLDSNGNWFEGKFTKILKRTNFFKRVIGFDDVILVDMTFHIMEWPPESDQNLKRYLIEAASSVSFDKSTGYPWGLKEYTKLVKADFRKCETASEVIQWLIKYNITMKAWDKY